MISPPFHPMGCLRQMVLISFILGFLTVLNGPAKAETVDYSADKVFMDAKINTASLRGKFVKLSDVFALVESQTNLNFFYVADRIPLRGEMNFEGAGVMSLADLLSMVSSLANVVFQRRDQTIIVRRAMPKSDKTSFARPQFGCSSAWV